MQPALDLSNTSVFFDFDGTITLDDVGVYLLEEFAADGWVELDEQYKAGALGSRECIELQWQCIPDSVNEAERRAAAAQVAVDPAFHPLVERLQRGGAEVAVVSDGWGFYIADAIAPLDIPAFTNTIDFPTNTLVSPYRDPSCEGCGVCGTCKPAIVRAAAQRGRSTVFVGDGTSDRHAARVADIVFAKGALARWCAEERIAHTSFETLARVASVLCVEPEISE
ncbi:MAG: 2-hydroxy-3-keto-5-methylthiopentenyl-phosphate phosphatase [Actinomycetota bacterium]